MGYFFFLIGPFGYYEILELANAFHLVQPRNPARDGDVESYVTAAKFAISAA